METSGSVKHHVHDEATIFGEIRRILSNLIPSHKFPCMNALFYTDVDDFDFDAEILDLDSFMHASDDVAWVSSPECEKQFTNVEFDFDRLSDVSVMKEEWDDEDSEPSLKEPRKSHDVSVVLPRVLKNDIRRSFSRMFFNAINCGDFQMVQDFSTAFIVPSCPFVASIRVNKEFSLPKILYGLGPRTHIHYLLGCFAMFPDIVATMGETQIITSNQFAGTKIVIPWDCRMTKTHHIPTECWIPPPDKVDKMYAEPSIARMMAALSVEDGSRSPSATRKASRTISPKAAQSAEKKRKRPVRESPAPSNVPATVPASFLESLLCDATPVKPLGLWTQGTYTIMLDENNQIQSIALEIRQADEHAQCPHMPRLQY